MMKMRRDDSWLDARHIPRDRVIDVIFHDDKGEYPGFPVCWDATANCWRNRRCGTPVTGTISGWREHRGRFRKTLART